jgi:hypothetical protein
MNPKQSVLLCSGGSERPFAHLQPIVDVLIANGNSYAHASGFFRTQAGWLCELKRPLDFDLIGRIFLLPDSIELVEANGSIWCRNCWSEICGG